MASLIYRIVLTGGEELHITLAEYSVRESGVLRITDADHKTTYYGPTAWVSIGLE